MHVLHSNHEGQIEQSLVLPQVTGGRSKFLYANEKIVAIIKCVISWEVITVINVNINVTSWRAMYFDEQYTQFSEVEKFAIFPKPSNWHNFLKPKTPKVCPFSVLMKMSKIKRVTNNIFKIERPFWLGTCKSFLATNLFRGHRWERNYFLT